MSFRTSLERYVELCFTLDVAFALVGILQLGLLEGGVGVADGFMKDLELAGFLDEEPIIWIQGL